MEKAKNFGTNYDALANEITICRDQGKKIVMCSGTFDLFHMGHMKLLNFAKKQGDILIVAVKSDKAAALKKADAPVLHQEIRMETIANYFLVNFVTMVDFQPNMKIPFSYENIQSYQWLNMFYPLLSKVKPAIFVHEENPILSQARCDMFSKYNIESLSHPRTTGISTTSIIDTIKSRILNQR